MAWIEVTEAENVQPKKPYISQVNGREIGLMRDGDDIYAFLNFCPHAGAPICEGHITGRVVRDAEGNVSYDDSARTIRCPWHRWEFDCKTGQAVTPIRQRLKTYPVRVEAGKVSIEV